jgi:hypothetical protein
MSLLRWSSGLALALLASAPVAAAQSTTGGLALFQSSYSLVDPAQFASLAPGADARWRLEAATGLGDRTQLRLSTGAFGQAAALGLGLPLEARATWRYTVLQQQSWAWRLGLTSALGERDPRGLAPLGRTRFGTLPLLHVAGEGSIAPRWLLGVEADGLMTGRGQRFELGLRVSYQLAPNFSLVGGYRLSEGSGDGEDLHYGPGIANSANVGLRLRF